jgi:hypothetical protein
MTLDYHGPSDMCRPFIWTLPLARRTFLFTDIKPSDVHGRKEAFRLISDAAQRADNVGTDEVPSVDYLDWLMGYTDAVIAISDVSTASDAAMIGLIIIHQCAYVRSYHASSFNLIVVTGETISSRLVWRDLARLGFEIGTRGERRYTACAINVFVTCYELVAALREEGFVITACIPEAGLVNGFPGRHIDSYVMYKELNCLPVRLLFQTILHTCMHRSINYR